MWQHHVFVRALFLVQEGTNVWYTFSAFFGVQYSVNLQIARCNNKDNVEKRFETDIYTYNSLYDSWSYNVHGSFKCPWNHFISEK
jgi:subtilase family serine protease